MQLKNHWSNNDSSIACKSKMDLTFPPDFIKLELNGSTYTSIKLFVN